MLTVINCFFIQKTSTIIYPPSSPSTWDRGFNCFFSPGCGMFLQAWHSGQTPRCWLKGPHLWHTNACFGSKNALCFRGLMWFVAGCRNQERCASRCECIVVSALGHSCNHGWCPITIHHNSQFVLKPSSCSYLWHIAFTNWLAEAQLALAPNISKGVHKALVCGMLCCHWGYRHVALAVIVAIGMWPLFS